MEFAGLAGPTFDVVLNVAVSLAVLGSGDPAFTYAVSVRTPKVFPPTLAVSVYTWLAPVPRVASVGQVTVCPDTAVGAGIADE